MKLDELCEAIDTMRNSIIGQIAATKRAEELHPNLDWAILRLNLNQIAYCIEWHDRFWPEEQRPEIGFRTNHRRARGR